MILHFLLEVPTEENDKDTENQESNVQLEPESTDIQAKGDSKPIDISNGYCRQRTTSTHSSHSLDSQGHGSSRKSSVSSEGQRPRSRKSSTRQSSVSEAEVQSNDGIEVVSL